jgi:hypothetical protein
LLVQALIEREIRLAMEADGIAELPLYPEERANYRPTTEQILRLFSNMERHTLLAKGIELQIFEPDFTELQKDVLRLLDVPESAFYRTN